MTEVENEEITNLVKKQKAAGYQVITDGEFRRSYWHLDFMWGFQGIKKIELDHGYYFHGEETTHGSIEVTGKITDKIYPDLNKLIEDIAKAYRTVIKDLYDAGCRNVQFDDCTWGMFCDPKYQEFVQSIGSSVEDEAERYLYLNNLAIEEKPEDLVITTHVCRGNYHSTWASSGGYETVAPYLFAKENVSAFYLEFDDERSGGFEPLRFVPKDKKVVLGLVTSKSPVLEDKELVISRIHQAEKYVPLENLYLSPQCGFASCEIGNKLTDEQQWAKLQLIKEIAEKVWK